ncbi:MAG: efflux transporter outer membrane subunit [Bacteroidales bacterium]
MCKKYIWIVLIGASALTSCKVGKSFSTPEIRLPERIEGNVPEDSSTVADLKWWELYTDPQLRNFISEALENNKDLLKAEAVIREFNQGKKIAFASMLPSLNIQLEGEREGTKDETDDTFGAKATFAWELDLWGKLRWANDGAKAKLLQTVEAQRALQVSIIAQVVQTYYELIALDKEYSIVKHTTNARKEAVRLAKLRFEGGLTSETALKQAEAELAKTETLIPSLEYKIRVKESEMALILGKFDDGSLTRSDRIHATPVNIPVGLPSQLLQRRPDIREAEYTLKEAHANVGVAYTSMFPSISLTSEGGLESGDLSNFIKSPLWNIGGGLISPLFSFGKNRANWKRSQAKMDQALLSYEKKVLEAFKEVNIALISVQKSKEIRESRQKSENAARSYLELANLQYINGVISYMDVLDAQRSLLDAEISLNNALLNEKMATSSLYKALGGGW